MTKKRVCMTSVVGGGRGLGLQLGGCMHQLDDESPAFVLQVAITGLLRWFRELQVDIIFLGGCLQWVGWHH